MGVNSIKHRALHSIPNPPRSTLAQYLNCIYYYFNYFLFEDRWSNKFCFKLTNIYLHPRETQENFTKELDIKQNSCISGYKIHLHYILNHVTNSENCLVCLIHCTYTYFQTMCIFYPYHSTKYFSNINKIVAKEKLKYPRKVTRGKVSRKKLSVVTLQLVC